MLKAKTIEMERNILKVKQVVADYYKVPIELFDDEKKNRAGDGIKLRKTVMYISRTLYPTVAFKTIGECLGGVPHNTVRHLFLTVQNEVDRTKHMGKDISAIINELVNRNLLTGLELSLKLLERFDYISLENVSVIRISATQAIVMTGSVPNHVIELIKQNLNNPAAKVIEYKQTGLSLITKKQNNERNNNTNRN